MAERGARTTTIEIGALAERFRTGTVDSNPRGLRAGPKPRASADLGGLTVRVTAPHTADRIRFPAPGVSAPTSALMASLAAHLAPRSDATVAAELADRLLHFVVAALAVAGSAPAEHDVV